MNKETISEEICNFLYKYFKTIEDPHIQYTEHIDILKNNISKKLKISFKNIDICFNCLLEINVLVNDHQDKVYFDNSLYERIVYWNDVNKRIEEEEIIKKNRRELITFFDNHQYNRFINLCKKIGRLSYDVSREQIYIWMEKMERLLLLELKEDSEKEND